jgi:hypothetical protein
MGWDTFGAFFSQTHLVTLLASDAHPPCVFFFGLEKNARGNGAYDPFSANSPPQIYGAILPTAEMKKVVCEEL